MDISAFSFVDAAKRASALMPSKEEGGGAMVSLTYLGSERVVPIGWQEGSRRMRNWLSLCSALGQPASSFTEVRCAIVPRIS